MGKTVIIAISPAIQLGGSLFTPKQLGIIRDLLETDVQIEMTSFKQLYAEVPIEKQHSIVAELENSGLEVNPAGYFTKSLIACNFCKGAEEAGLATAEILNVALAGISTPTPLKIGYAGCALGTSEPLIKDISVIKMRDTFDLYVGGESKGLKTKFAKKLHSGLYEEQLVPVILAIINFYKGNAKGKEKFSKFIDRITLDYLRQIIVPSSC